MANACLIMYDLQDTRTTLHVYNIQPYEYTNEYIHNCIRYQIVNLIV